jgi:hypothetical protein
MDRTAGGTCAASSSASNPRVSITAWSISRCYSERWAVLPASCGPGLMKTHMGATNRLLAVSLFICCMVWTDDFSNMFSILK